MLRREAARWLARLQSKRDPDVERKFRRWHDADPAHSAAFERVQRSYELAGLLHRSPAASPDVGARASQVERRPRYAIAAAAALIVLVPAGILLVGGLPFADTHATMLATEVGEIRQVGLGDGSKVTLDTATVVEVEIGQSTRRARLERGRARFQVARSADPFVIDAGDVTVTTADGVVDVERSGRQSRVEVLAGDAEIRAPDGSEDAELTLRAGESVTTSNSETRRTQAAGGADWTRGMLQFDGTPLETAVGLANRYSTERIVVRDDLAQLRVTGAFRAGDTAGLAKALAAAFDLSLGRTANGNLLLSRGGRSEGQRKNGG